MFHLIISLHGKASDLTTLGPTCVAAPPLLLVLSEPHYKGFKYHGIQITKIIKTC